MIERMEGTGNTKDIAKILREADRNMARSNSDAGRRLVQRLKSQQRQKAATTRKGTEDA